MQVLCKSTTGNAEISCCVCGQGFVLFWERQSRSERMEALQEIQKTLRGHHQELAGVEAHPQTGFLIPEWDGPIAASGAGLLGHAPTWAL
jgi:hypothetical protein